MKVTYKELLDSSDALSRFTSLPQPPALSVMLKHVLRSVTTAFADFNATRKELCERHGKENAENQTYEFETPEIRKAFDADYLELTEATTTVPGRRIKLSEIKAELTPADLFALEWLIDDEYVPEPEPTAVALDTIQTKIDETQPDDILDLGQSKAVGA